MRTDRQAMGEPRPSRKVKSYRRSAAGLIPHQFAVWEDPLTEREGQVGDASALAYARAGFFFDDRPVTQFLRTASPFAPPRAELFLGGVFAIKRCTGFAREG